MIAELDEKLKRIKLLILDVDGILTNGTINIDHNGDEFKSFNVHDGFGLVIMKKAGYKTAIITARSSAAVNTRAKDLRIDKVYQDAYPKLIAYELILKEFQLTDDQVCFMGDDLPDLAVLNRVGLSVSVPNGTNEVKSIVDYITTRPGGYGAVREVAEMILKSQGKWEKVIKNHE